MRARSRVLRVASWTATVAAVAVVSAPAAGANFRVDRNVLWAEPAPHANDMWGSVLAVGDFNHDGYDDLALGDPGYQKDGKSNVGRVCFAWGFPGATLVTCVTQESFGSGEEEDGDQFGFSLAVGDFDGNGRDDLAIGVPGENVDGVVNAGAVCVMYGTSTGPSYPKIWTQDDPIIHGSAEPHDKFGYTLAAGDVNGDGHDDLAVGCPFEDIGAIEDAGEVHVIYGSANRLSDDVLSPQDLDQGQAEIPGVAEEGDLLGMALAIGRLNGDAFQDLVVGIPFEDIEAVEDAGGLMVFPGSAGGASVAGVDWYDWRFTSPDDDAVPEAGMRLGAHVAIVRGCVAMACPGASGDGYDSHGQVIVVPVLLQLMHGHYYTTFYPEELQDHAMGKGPLLVADVNNDGKQDLLMGFDRYDMRGRRDAGALLVVYDGIPDFPIVFGFGGPKALFSQFGPRMVEPSGDHQQFGYALAAGDFNGDGVTDVAVGMPGYPAGGQALSGAVSVLYGGSTGLNAFPGAWLLLSD